jgi:hypothetical protein
MPPIPTEIESAPGVGCERTDLGTKAAQTGPVSSLP